MDLVVVVVSSLRGGRPKAGWSEIKIRQLVLVASRGDIVVAESRVDCRRGVLRRNLYKRIIM